jgi:hypothetical protein
MGGLVFETPPPPPFVQEMLTGQSDDPLPGGTDVVPIAGDSHPEDPPDDFGDGHYYPQVDPPKSPPNDPPVGGPPILPSLGPNPFDDDDDDEEPTETAHTLWWVLGVGALVAIGFVILGFVLTSGSGTKSPPSSVAQSSVTVPPPLRSPSTPASPISAPSGISCTPPAVPADLHINWGQALMARECVGPAQYPSDPRNSSYSYFAWETTLHNHQVQLVITSAPISGSTTAKVTPDVQTALQDGAHAAQVDVYDNATNTKNFAKSGSVTLSPSGKVKFVQVHVTLWGQPCTINGWLPAD